MGINNLAPANEITETITKQIPTFFPSIMMIAFSLLDNNLTGITLGLVSFFTVSFIVRLINLDSFFFDKSIEFTTRPVNDDSVVNKHIDVYLTENVTIYTAISKGLIFNRWKLGKDFYEFISIVSFPWNVSCKIKENLRIKILWTERPLQNV